MAKLHVSNSITSEKFGNDYAIIVMACFFVSSLTVFFRVLLRGKEIDSTQANILFQ